MTQTPSLRRGANENDIRPFDDTTAHVILQDGAAVRIDLESLEDLNRRGITARFYSYRTGQGHTYVAVHLPANLGGTTTVAGLIVKRPPGSGVSYVNGNRMDLRRSNLFVAPRGRGRKKALEAHASMLFPNDLDGRAAWLDAEIARRKAAAARRTHTKAQPARLAA